MFAGPFADSGRSCATRYAGGGHDKTITDSDRWTADRGRSYRSGRRAKPWAWRGRKPRRHDLMLGGFDGERRRGRRSVEARGQPARAGRLERARGLGGRRSPRRIRSLSAKLPGDANDAECRQPRTDLRRALERLPRSRWPASARCQGRARLFRAEFPARAHCASRRGGRTAHRLFRAGRARLAPSQSRIPCPALSPPARPGRRRPQTRFHCVSQQGCAHRPPGREQPARALP